MPTAGNSGLKSAAPPAFLRTIIYGLEIAIIAVLYVGVASTALLFPAITAIQTPLWPPSGIALALILLRGYRIWPGILIGSFSAIAISSGMLTVQSPAIAVGTTLGALAGARLINYWSYGTKTFFTPLGIARFVLFAFVPTAMLSTAGAISGQLFTAPIDFHGLAVTAAIWWLADAVASMIVAPVIVLWATPPLREGARLDLPETAGIVIGAAVTGAIAFLAVGALKPLLPYQNVCGFLILLPLIWASLRGNQRAAATAALIFCGLAAWGFVDTTGAASSPNSLLLLSAVAISMSIAPLFLSTAVAAHNYRQTHLSSELNRT